MNPISNLFVLFIFCVSLCFANYKIDTDIPFCIQTDEIVDFDSCVLEQELMKKLICLSEINSLKVAKDQYNDEFKYVYTVNDKKMFFFLNQNVYNTKCSKIESFEIHDTVDSCTRDILVTFKKDGISNSGYLTKEEIIRKDSVTTECKNEIFLGLDNNRFNVVKKSKTIEVVEKANKQSGNPKFKIETEMSTETKYILQKMYALYQKLEFNPYFQMFKDLISLIMLIVIFIVIIVLFVKNKNKHLLTLIRGALNVYNAKENIKESEGVEKIEKADEKINKKTIEKYKSNHSDIEIKELNELRTKRRSSNTVAINHNANVKVIAPQAPLVKVQEKKWSTGSSYPSAGRETQCRLCALYFTENGLGKHQYYCAQHILNKNN